jgi:hypothetical protein
MPVIILTSRLINGSGFKIIEKRLYELSSDHKPNGKEHRPFLNSLFGSFREKCEFLD